MKTEGLITYWEKPEMVSQAGEYALLSMVLGGEEVVTLDGEETHGVTFFESYTGKVWYKGNAGGAFGMLQKAFYRLGVPEIGLENYALAGRIGDDLVTVAEFGEAPDVAEVEKLSQSERIMQYEFAWQHRCTAELWKSPIHKTIYDKFPPEITGWMRRRCDLVRSYRRAEQLELEVPTAEELRTLWIQIRKTVKTGVVVEMGPVLKTNSGQAERVYALPKEICEAYVALRRAGKTKGELLTLWEVSI